MTAIHLNSGSLQHIIRAVPNNSVLTVTATSAVDVYVNALTGKEVYVGRTGA